MKKISLFVLLMAFAFSIMKAETSYDKMKSLYNSKDYEEATAFVQQATKDNPKDLDVFILAGDIYFELDKLDSALYFYRKADDIKSKQGHILRKIGKTLSIKGNHQEAIKQLRNLVELEPKNSLNHLELGKAFIKADSIRQAELVITKAREMNKKIPDAYVALGDLYFAQKVYELARSNYEEALALDENLTEARVKLATAYYWLGNKELDEALSQELFKRSLKEWNIVTQKDPKNAKAFFEQGKILWLANRFGDAASSFYQFIKLRPSASLGRWYLAQCLFEVGKCDSAAPQLQIVAQEIDSVKDKARLKLAQCYFEQKRFAESIEIYKQLKDAGKIENIDLERLAAAVFRTGDTLTAIQYYKELVNKDKSRCGTMLQLGSLTLFMKKFEESLYFYQMNYLNCPDTTTRTKSLYYIAYNFSNLTKPDSAMYYIDKCLNLDNSYVGAFILKADIYASMKSNDTATVFFKEAIAKGKADTSKYSRELNQAYIKLCGLLINDKNFKEMNKVAKEWTEFDDKNEYAWLYLAVSYQGTSDIENAKKFYKKVLQINPKNKTASEMLKKLEAAAPAGDQK